MSEVPLLGFGACLHVVLVTKVPFRVIPVAFLKQLVRFARGEGLGPSFRVMLA